MEGDPVFEPGPPGCNDRAAGIERALLALQHGQERVYACAIAIEGYIDRLLGCVGGADQCCFSGGKFIVYRQCGFHLGQCGQERIDVEFDSFVALAFGKSNLRAKAPTLKDRLLPPL